MRNARLWFGLGVVATVIGVLPIASGLLRALLISAGTLTACHPAPARAMKTRAGYHAFRDAFAGLASPPESRPMRDTVGRPEIVGLPLAHSTVEIGSSAERSAGAIR
jgi:hypothetical protein